MICNVDVAGDYDAGVVRFKLKNIEDFGPTNYTVEPDAITDQALEEFAKLLIGKDSNFRVFSRRAASTFNPGSTGQFARTAAKSAQYAAVPEPVEVEKKQGLFGSLKSVFKKPD